MALPRILMAVALAAASAAPALAKEAAPPRFLTQDQIAQATRLPAPPKEGSAEARSEMDELHRLERTRTPERLARARRDDVNEKAAMFGPALGPGFDLARLPAVARMLQDVRNDEKLAATAGKAFYKRKRPFIVDPGLQSCSRDEKPLTSYPSGHATMAYAMAVVLADAWPSRKGAIMARASDYSESRLVCGMHFRSDIEAGRILGEEIGRDLLANPAFKAEESAAAKELAALD